MLITQRNPRVLNRCHDGPEPEEQSEQLDELKGFVLRAGDRRHDGLEPWVRSLGVRW